MSFLLGGLEAIDQDGSGGISLALDSTVKESNSQEGTSLNIILVAFQVLINGLQTLIDVPEPEQAEGAGSSHLSLGLVLEDPVLLAFLCLGNHLVVTQAHVDEGVHVSLGQVLHSRVQLLAIVLSLLQVGLENLIGHFRLFLVQVLGELLEVLAELLLRDNLIQVSILRFEGVPLSSEHEGHLLEDNGVLALLHNFTHLGHVVHSLGHA
mmetsp:Transcript_18748/g.28790  ORF Transcript_18748/g.28790 Transcript_18748/m.28790 type:complete len:209 (+) Transcript_18748:1312-1938(+)